MASRIVSTLNDLDKISNRIYHKHSKERFRAGIEAKLKSSREKAERSLREIDEGSSDSSKVSSSNNSSIGSATLSSRYFSSSASTSSRSTTSECQNKAGKEKTRSEPSTSKPTESRQRERIQRRKTKSCPSCSVDNNTVKNYQTDDADEVPRTVSVFGKCNGKGSEYKPTAWFNLPQETSVGVIDTLACNAMNKKPLCYSVNVKKGESVPNLLRNKLEVRVGQNGIVRTEKKTETVMLEVCDRDVTQGKKRTAPLSWEEQLHWHNACVILSEPITDGNPASKNLCETHPVIFHEKKPTEQEKESKPGEDKNHLPTYKVSLESRWVYADRRNLVSSSSKCITSVEIEDTRSVDGEVVCSEKKHLSQDSANHSKKEHTRVLNTGGRVAKKVSFEDKRDVKEKTVSNKTEEDSGKNETRTLEEATAVDAKTDDTDKVPFVLSSVPKVRPKTSYERSRRDDEDATKDVQKLQRPNTAPSAPPSSPRNYSDSRLSYNFAPIKIPTSQVEVENDNFLSQNQTNGESQNSVELSQSSSPEDEKQNDIEENEEFAAFSVQISPGSSTEQDTVQNDSAPKKRVSFGGYKSAPLSRTTFRQAEANLPRAKSSTAIQQRRPCKAPPPVVVESESSLELPKDLPPAQALVALRKKIRDDLAQQNHELQLDIQQLYLRKHSE